MGVEKCSVHDRQTDRQTHIRDDVHGTSCLELVQFLGGFEHIPLPPLPGKLLITEILQIWDPSGPDPFEAEPETILDVLEHEGPESQDFLHGQEQGIGQHLVAQPTVDLEGEEDKNC